MSSHDNTQIYLLKYSAIAELSEHILANVLEISRRNAQKETLQRCQPQLDQW
jgi:hypothetical protein